MNKVVPSRPPPPEKLIDLGFLDARSKVIDVAAFLDRMDRHNANDFRVDALRRAVRELLSDEPERARRILEQLSDHSTDPAATAQTQSACGAPPPGMES